MAASDKWPRTVLYLGILAFIGFLIYIEALFWTIAGVVFLGLIFFYSIEEGEKETTWERISEIMRRSTSVQVKCPSCGHTFKADVDSEKDEGEKT